MMKTIGIHILIVFAICKAKGNVSTPFPLQTTTSSPIPVVVITNFTGLAQIVQDVNIYQDNIGETEEQPTNEPDLNLELPNSNGSPSSHHPETSQLPQIPQGSLSEDVDDSIESNSMNEIFNGDNNVLNLELTTILPEVENVVKEEPSITSVLTISEPWVTPYYETEIDAFIEGTESSEIRGDNVNTELNRSSGKLGLESWKIGLIFTAAFIAVEALVLVIYFLVCRKRRLQKVKRKMKRELNGSDIAILPKPTHCPQSPRREPIINIESTDPSAEPMRAVIAKSCEQDSEAGDTINVESHDNTLTNDEGTIIGAPVPKTKVCLQTTGQQEDEQRKSELRCIITNNRSTEV